MNQRTEYYRKWTEKRKMEINGIDHLICGLCKVEKHISSFYKSRICHSRSPLCIECEKIKKQESYRKNIVKNLIRIARLRAKKRGIEFSITENDLKFNTVCPLLGIPIQVNTGGKAQNNNSPNIDRIDPSKGYVKGNVWIISSRANRLKNNSTLKELELLYTNLKNLGVP